MNYISISRVLESVYQDEGYAHELDWNDAINWTGRALRLIAAPAVYIEKTTGNSLLTPDVTVTDYRGSLPIDFVDLLPGGVRDADTDQVYDHNTDSFRTRQQIVVEEPVHNTGRLSYSLKESYIDINKQTATLHLAYKAFMIDDDGFPMVPDNQRVEEAIRAFITERTDHRLWRQNRISEAVYRDSEREWLWYIGSAQNALRITSPDRRNTWTRHWTRLLPVIGQFDYSNAFLGNNEDLNIGFNDVNNLR